jgi:hypothetical protein
LDRAAAPSTATHVFVIVCVQKDGAQAEPHQQQQQQPRQQQQMAMQQVTMMMLMLTRLQEQRQQQQQLAMVQGPRRRPHLASGRPAQNSTKQKQMK